MKIDSNIDVTSVDFPPSFKVCDSLISKKDKTSCFRNTMHREMYKSLAKQPIRLKPFTDETITVVIKIQVDQQVKLVSFSASDNLKNQMPTLEAVIEKSISDLPTIHPAVKRGMLVTTEYRIPIRFKFNG